jgi:hypothetical protein
MYYRLSPSQEKELLSQPETGMGYQAIEAQLPGIDMKAKFIVLNAELAVELNEAAPLCVKEIARDGIEKVLSKAMDFRWRITKVILHDYELKPVSVANDMKVENPDGGEIFVRRSIYENDKRIDAVNKCLRPGSFTTTLPDSIKYKHSSEDPLIQLAMDHGVRGQWGFHVQPKRNDSLQRGKANPQTGAKEVFFKNGTSFGTFIKREAYAAAIKD